ncbi:MAG: MFS transporter [Thermoleophilia bacterium]|nr:MFS transporter [Thermoleophilia bacterium]
MHAPPLRRNRDFVLLQAAELLSSGGSQLTAIAYPLLVLAVTGSGAKAGLVAFARLLAMALLALPAGLAADRWNRRRVMIAAHAVRGAAIGSLAALVFVDVLPFWPIPLVAFVEGSGSAFYAAAQAGALRAVVPAPQLPSAVAVVTGRAAAISLAAPPVGGALFGLVRALPFAVHTTSYVFSTLALLAVKTPFQEARERDPAPLRSRLAEGFGFLWGRPFLRTCAFLFGLSNFIGPGVLLALVVIGKREGLTGGQVGLLLSAFAACVLLGSFLSPLVRRRLPVRGVLVLELWTWAGCAVFVVWPSVYVLAASLLPTALAIPSTNSVVRAYELALTPDRLLGRVESVRSTMALLPAPLGPLTAGVLLDAVSPRAAIAVFAAFGLLLALWGTLSPSIRAAPRLDELGGSARGPTPAVAD